MSLHLSEVYQTILSRNSARSASIIMGIGAIAMIPLQVRFPNSPLNRFIITSTGLTLAVSAQYQMKRDRALSALLQDTEDISHDAYQGNLWRRMQPVDARIQSVSPAAEVETLDLFDWNLLADPDLYPTICCFAPMGGGKSTIMQWIARHIIQAEQGEAFDMHCNDWGDWLTVHTDPEEIYDQMTADLDTVDELRKLSPEEKRNLPQQVRILDEAPDTLLELRLLESKESKVVTRWLSRMTTFVRKLRIRTLVGAVTIAADDLGISSSKRNSMAVIFPGMPGVQLATSDRTFYMLGTKENRELRNQLIDSLKGLRRPALVYLRGTWYPAEIPELTPDGDPIGYSAARIQPARPARPAPPDVDLGPSVSDSTRQSLDRLYHSSDELRPLTNLAKSLASYLSLKGEMEIRTLAKNWGRNKGLNMPDLMDLVGELVTHGIAVTDGKTIRLK